MQDIDRILSLSTTPIDLYKIGGKRCNVFTYPEISKFTSISQLFKKGNSELEKNCSLLLPFTNKCCIILYLNGPRSGHWTMLNKRKNAIDFLDSYGDVIDDQLQYVNKNIIGQNKKKLIGLLKKYHGDVWYNDIKLQKLSSNISTCGRYCGLYLKYNYMNVDKFCNMLVKCSDNFGITTDQLVCILTKDV